MSKSDRLEEENKLEMCKSCMSVHIIETESGVVCGTCGTENYTMEIDEEDFINLDKIKNE